MAYFVQTMGQALHDGRDALIAATRMLKRDPLYRKPLRELMQAHRSAGFIGIEVLALRLMPDVLLPVEKIGMAAAVVWGTPSHYKSVLNAERQAVWGATGTLWPKRPISAANDNDDESGSEGGTPPVAPTPTSSVMSYFDDIDLSQDNDDDEPSAPRFG